MTTRYAAELRSARDRWWARRDLLLRELDRRRRQAIAQADRPGNAYDPNASGDPDPDPGFEWDTRTRIHGIECFGGQHHEVYTDHYSLRGNYVGVDRRHYDEVRSTAAADGAFCGAWETRRETTTRQR
jgi:hypothetical protein